MDVLEKKEFMESMGWRVKNRREELKMSQEELALRLNYKNKASISRIESGLNEIPQSKMRAFASALDTSIEYLMGWDAKPQLRLKNTFLSEDDFQTKGNFFRRRTGNNSLLS